MSTVTATSQTKKMSRVLEAQAPDPSAASQHFRSKLAFETDPSDVYTDLENGETGFVVIDARTPEAYARGHVPRAINIWHRTVNAETTAALPKNKVLVTYCAGVFCNASAKAALKLSSLGFRVKEMLDGIDGWKQEGYPLETGSGPMTVQTPVKHSHP